ncbi:hypothetical protein TIFTF001_001178 [Ficus carica]|uniref:Disease resistance R13L4/SHOC-2-like LRR domain-containing protein n=1 Tax=Ficus carica TaxID=3494 RepID=A0AA88CQK9_FICCA|nr:hypothetical protein TIFTF001_001178 [Ficus carica]
MCNLRILKIYNSPLGESIVRPSEDLQSLSDKLTYLQWDGYSSKIFPINFIPENLVELVMPNSQVEQLWSGVQPLGSLKKIDLSGCSNLTKTPDLSDALNLTNLTLEGCLSLGKFPELPRNVKNLNLSKTSIREVPSSIQRVSCLEIFDLSDCRNLESLPTAICKLKSLQSLYLSGCSKFRNFPEIVEPMERLAELELDRTAIKKLHPSIENLVGLVSLHLKMCQNLEFVPDSIYNISSLEYVSLWQCVRLKCPSPDDLPKYLDASRTVVPRVESSRTVLMRRRDSFSNVGSSTRRYNYLQRVPAETAGSSSNQQSYSDLMILNPEPKESRIAPSLREESILREESTLSKFFSTTLKWRTKG